MQHLWSLAVQIHFYLVFPLLLWWASPSQPGFRKRIITGAIIAFIGCSLFRYGAAHAAGITMPLPPYGHPNMGSKAADVGVRYYHTLYFATSARICNLAMGVILALVLMNNKVSTHLNAPFKH